MTGTNPHQNQPQFVTNWTKRESQSDRDFDEHVVINTLQTIKRPRRAEPAPCTRRQIGDRYFSLLFLQSCGKNSIPIIFLHETGQPDAELLSWQGTGALIRNVERFLSDFNRKKVKKDFCSLCCAHISGQDGNDRQHLFCYNPNFSKSIYTFLPAWTKIKVMNLPFQEEMQFVI